MTQNFQIPKINFAKYLVFILVLLIADWNFRKDERLEKGERFDFVLIIIQVLSVLFFSAKNQATNFIYFDF